MLELVLARVGLFVFSPPKGSHPCDKAGGKPLPARRVFDDQAGHLPDSRQPRRQAVGGQHQA